MTTKAPSAALATPLTRQQLRDQLLGHAPKPQVKELCLFGIMIDLRQPTLKAILDAQSTEDAKIRMTDMVVNYAYVPGTNERIFDTADSDMILQWPFGPDLLALQKAVADLTGIDISGAEKELEANPLKEPS